MNKYPRLVPTEPPHERDILAHNQDGINVTTFYDYELPLDQSLLPIVILVHFLMLISTNRFFPSLLFFLFLFQRPPLEPKHLLGRRINCDEHRIGYSTTINNRTKNVIGPERCRLQPPMSVTLQIQNG